MPHDVKEHPAEGRVARSLTPFDYALDGIADPSTATDFSATLVNLMRSVKDRTRPDPHSDPRLMRYLGQPPMPGERYRIESPPPPPPPVDFSGPGVADEAPVVDLSGPGVADEALVVDLSEPGVVDDTLVVDRSEPGVAHDAPVVDRSEPGVVDDGPEGEVAEATVDSYQPRIASFEPPDDSIDTGSYSSSVSIGAPQVRAAQPDSATPGSADQPGAPPDNYTPPPFGAYAYAEDEIEKDPTNRRLSKPRRSRSTIAVVGPLVSIVVAGLLVGTYLLMRNRDSGALVDISTSQGSDQTVDTEVASNGASGLTVSESAQIETEITLMDAPIDSELPQGQARIEGLVRTAQGQPVPEATVEFSPVDNTQGGTVATAITAADGTYEFMAEAGCYLVHFVPVDGVEVDPANQDRELCLASQVVGTVDGVLAQ